MNDDMALLQDYAKCGSENAFRTLVDRHIDFVYSAALRQTGNPHLAEEITQVVFIILARKAGSISKTTILAGWLFRTTRFAANDALKKEIRRQRREQEVFQMESTLQQPETESEWQQVSPLLDEAIAGLGDKDRNAVLLRFFEKKNLKDVGVALGTNEEAAKKRVSRAVDKLRNVFAKRGAVFPATALVSVLSANSISAAPAGLASSVAVGATAKGAVAGASALTLIKGTLEIMAWTKAKAAAAVAAAVIIGGGTTAVVVKEVVLPRVKESTSDDSLWQVNTLNLDRQPRIILIRPTRFPNGGGWCMRGERILGQNASVGTLMQIAYQALPIRTVLPSDLPKGKFDFLVNLPTGGRKEFQQQLRNQFGVTARREAREMDVLVLRVKTPNAAGLKTSTQQNGSSYAGPGELKVENQPISALAGRLEEIFKMPVVNRTGLKANYDFELNWSGGDSPAQIEPLKVALMEQLGLELVPSRERIEMLIIERVRN